MSWKIPMFMNDTCTCLNWKLDYIKMVCKPFWEKNIFTVQSKTILCLFMCSTFVIIFSYFDYKNILGLVNLSTSKRKILEIFPF